MDQVILPRTSQLKTQRIEMSFFILSIMKVMEQALNANL